MSADEADMAKAGTLAKDPKAGAKKVAADVPRVLTVQEILGQSAIRALTKEKKDVCTTGHYKLDSITGGMRKGFTWLVGADTSWGKSSFLVSVVDENIKLGKRCLIVSSEDTEEVYGDRLMVRRSRVDAKRYRDQNLTAAEMSRVTTTAQAGEQLPVFVDARRWALEDLAPHLLKLIQEQSIDMIAFDYLQEFRSTKKFQDERVKFREIASLMRYVIKSSKITGVIYSQLTMSAETKIPNRHNIRECRDVGNAAEVILIGFEPDSDILDGNKRVVVEAGAKCVFVDKVKNGPRGGKIAMKWSADHACFDLVVDPEVAKVEPYHKDMDFVSNGFEDGDPF